MVIVTKKKIRQKKTKKTDNMPISDDVGKLATYLDDKREACFIELTNQYSYRKWLLLSKLTLLSVLVFNRRRVDDTQNILLSEFNEREIIADHRDSSLLSEFSCGAEDPTSLRGTNLRKQFSTMCGTNGTY